MDNFKGETRQALLNRAFLYIVLIGFSFFIFLRVRALLFDLFVAVVLSVLAEPIVYRLSKRFNRRLSTIITVGTIILVIGGIIFSIIPIMVQDAPLSGVELSIDLLVKMAQEIEAVKLFKIECPRAAGKIRKLIEQGGNAVEAPFDGEEAITLLADLDAGATGSMTSGMIVDQIKPVITQHLAGNISAQKGGTIALIARNVENQGEINTPDGSTALISGESVTLTMTDNTLVNFEINENELDKLIKEKNAISTTNNEVFLTNKGKNDVLSAVIDSILFVINSLVVVSTSFCKPPIISTLLIITLL